MGLFGSKEDKLEKQRLQEQEELNKLMSKYNLRGMDKEDLKVLRRISSDLSGNGFFKAGMALSFAKAEEQAKVTYLSALVEQNWLMIKQLSDINNKLGELVKED